MYINTKLLIFSILLISWSSKSMLNAQKKIDPTSKHSSEKNIVYIVKLHEEISPASSRLIDNAIRQAKQQKAQSILIDLNTYGGLVDDADKIRTSLLKTDLQTLIFIRNNAASAGALISIACDSIYMSTGATIGAATVVNQNGEVMPDKYQSYMRNKMRATAEATGRNPDIAEAMVDESVEIKNISKQGKVLTFTVDQAIKNGYCNAKKENINEIIDIVYPEKPIIVEHQTSFIDKIIGFLIHPMVSSLLIMMIFGGIYFELQSPGVGFPIAAAILGAILYFAPLYIEGLAENWEIIIFILGIIFIALEIFVIPGFGVAGIMGIVLMITGLTLAMVQNIFFDFSFVPSEEMTYASLIVSGTFIGSMILFFTIGMRFLNTTIFDRLALTSEQKASEGYRINASEEENQIGQTGISITDLRPSGKIDIAGKRYDALSDMGFISKGTTIQVLDISSRILVVRATNEKT